ncbi:MAG: hypothetical protein EOS04_08065 [Mesorhizobium sp.]|nr:MAG: hypothetical protein EOR98_14490 [Mesorhizobium sp.]RWN89977.1 MAG: hypothetical protein EOS04_08065 [Mesorhizobium sp.]RWO73343.1 MAG: hypothetical protein EOS16_03230 [Mesorhizobium sp.]
MMPAIGALDTGRMGSELARALPRAGYRTTVRDRTAEEPGGDPSLHHQPIMERLQKANSCFAGAKQTNHVGEARLTTAGSGGRFMTNRLPGEKA